MGCDHIRDDSGSQIYIHLLPTQANLNVQVAPQTQPNLPESRIRSQQMCPLDLVGSHLHCFRCKSQFVIFPSKSQRFLLTSSFLLMTPLCFLSLWLRISDCLFFFSCLPPWQRKVIVFNRFCLRQCLPSAPFIPFPLLPSGGGRVPHTQPPHTLRQCHSAE